MYVYIYIYSDVYSAATNNNNNNNNKRRDTIIFYTVWPCGRAAQLATLGLSRDAAADVVTAAGWPDSRGAWGVVPADGRAVWYMAVSSAGEGEDGSVRREL